MNISTTDRADATDDDSTGGSTHSQTFLQQRVALFALAGFLLGLTFLAFRVGSSIAAGRLSLGQALFFASTPGSTVRAELKLDDFVAQAKTGAQTTRSHLWLTVANPGDAQVEAAVAPAKVPSVPAISRRLAKDTWATAAALAVWACAVLRLRWSSPVSPLYAAVSTKRASAESSTGTSTS